MTLSSSGFSPFTVVTGTFMLCIQPLISDDFSCITSYESLKTFIADSKSIDFQKLSAGECHSFPKPNIPRSLRFSPPVWLGLVCVRKSLEAPYSSPYEVIARCLNLFTLKLSSSTKSVPINHLKPAFISSLVLTKQQPTCPSKALPSPTSSQPSLPCPTVSSPEPPPVALNIRPRLIPFRILLSGCSEGLCDIYWCDVGAVKDLCEYNGFDGSFKICHFLNHYELTRKNLIVKNLKRWKKQFERSSGKIGIEKFDFFPTTYELPNEYHLFVEEFKRNPGTIWIMKPAAKSQGKGIFLFCKLKDITDWRKNEFSSHDQSKEKEVSETYVVQKYIENPYLIGGCKFDLRVYVLVTSYNPLKVWLYRDGFARFSGTRFSMDNIQDMHVHLTNVAVQKTTAEYDVEKGCKWSIKRLIQYLTARHNSSVVDTLLQEMNNIIITTLQSVQKVMINDKHCFELYGYDILIDDNFKPWLIEVNASPSLTATNNEDYNLKYSLLEDVFNVIDLENRHLLYLRIIKKKPSRFCVMDLFFRLTGNEKRVGGFDLLWNDGLVYADHVNGFAAKIGATSPVNSFLVGRFLIAHKARVYFP
ncbi:putative tubulin polyglutamylase TTLL9 [Nymphon striatum]|nr:putative tubulin polyglutamylase TTLL9 [Nymphon striatum]